ncbi:bcl-2-like protein 10 [Bos indicus x Bos taurus]|nr:bcl-2-like protein 10 [Bos indicus x Bos taurus]
MVDPFRERTARLLMDYLEFCAREPGTPAPAPSTPEAAVLRHVAARIQEANRNVLPLYRRCRRHRVELVARMAQRLLDEDPGPSWGRVASLVTFAGSLLERPPQTTRRQEKRDDDGVSRDCRLLVALLCAQFCERHRAWLMTNGGWDGFCLFFSHSFQPSWERQLVWFFLSYWTAIIIIYFWIKLSANMDPAKLVSSQGNNICVDKKPA